MDDDLIPVPHLHTLTQISEQLQVPSETVRRWIEARDLAAYVLDAGGEDRYRVSEDDLALFVHRKRMNGSHE